MMVDFRGMGKLLEKFPHPPTPLLLQNFLSVNPAADPEVSVRNGWRFLFLLENEELR